MPMLLYSIEACVRKPLEVTDTSALQSVTISVDNTSETWDIGTVRTFVLGCEPSEAEVSGYNLISRKDGIFEISRVEGADNVFDVQAIAEGSATLVACADDKRDSLTFSVVDNRPAPVAPDITVYVTRLDVATDIVELDEIYKAEDGGEYVVNVSADAENVQFELTTSDEKIANIRWGEDGDWVISAEKPGKAEIGLKVTDADGNSFETDADGLLAVCIQHEIDHLKGRVFVDYLSPMKRNRIKKKLLKEEREQKKTTSGTKGQHQGKKR